MRETSLKYTLIYTGILIFAAISTATLKKASHHQSDEPQPTQAERRIDSINRAKWVKDQQVDYVIPDSAVLPDSIAPYPKKEYRIHRP